MDHLGPECIIGILCLFHGLSVQCLSVPTIVVVNKVTIENPVWRLKIHAVLSSETIWYKESLILLYFQFQNTLCSYQYFFEWSFMFSTVECMVRSSPRCLKIGPCAHRCRKICSNFSPLNTSCRVGLNRWVPILSSNVLNRNRTFFFPNLFAC